MSRPWENFRHLLPSRSQHRRNISEEKTSRFFIYSKLQTAWRAAFAIGAALLQPAVQWC